MWLDWLSSRTAVKVGNSLADHLLAPAAQKGGRAAKAARPDKAIQSFLAKVDSEAKPLRLGFFRRAKLANTFRWRLLDQGMDPALANELTRMLVLRLS